tara:strand:+ start:390 stop:527 length:138 start_codon:yes stop_codon:yes gene_type:complete
MINDRITEDLDWREGMNAFRLKIIEELKQINEKIEELKQTKEKTP